MARRRRRRSYGGLVEIPTVGSINLRTLNPMGKSVSSTDVLVGAGVGLAGGMGVKYALNKLGITPKLPAIILSNLPAFSAIAAGALALLFQRNKHRGTGHFVGAVAAGLAPVIGAQLVKTFPQFASYHDLVSIPQVGMLIDDGYAGLLVDDASGQMGNLAGLAAYGAEGDPAQLEPA